MSANYFSTLFNQEDKGSEGKQMKLTWSKKEVLTMKVPVRA